MGLNLDIENFEPSSDTKFQDLIDWLNESFQKISTSPIIAECRDQKGNLVWDKDNPVYIKESDKITGVTSGSSGEITFDNILESLVEENNTYLKVLVRVIGDNYPSDNNSSYKFTYNVEMYDSKTDHILGRETYEKDVRYQGSDDIYTFYISNDELSKNNSGEIDIGIRIKYNCTYTSSAYNNGATFDLSSTVLIEHPKLYL